MTAVALTRANGPTAMSVGRRIHMSLLVVVVILNLLGLVMIMSASSYVGLHQYGSTWYFVQRQALWMAAGFIALFAVARHDYRRLRRLAGPFLAVSFVLLVAVLIPGVGRSVYGAQRWLGLGPITIQPSELVKLAMVLYAADLLSRRAAWIDDERVTVRPLMVLLAAASGLIMLQPNLGTTIIIASIVVLVAFFAGVRLGPLTVYTLLGAAVAAMFTLGTSWRRARFFAFLDPWSKTSAEAYQTMQSLISVASGGLVGVGLGASRAKWGFLPFAHTDFIFAIVAEELGLIGAGLVVVLFLAIGFLGIRAAVGAPDRFGSLLAVGIACWFVVQATINIGAVIGVLPITGVPLPFLTFGGTSLVVNMAAMGVLLNVARQAR